MPTQLFTPSDARIFALVINNFWKYWMKIGVMHIEIINSEFLPFFFWNVANLYRGICFWNILFFNNFKFNVFSNQLLSFHSLILSFLESRSFLVLNTIRIQFIHSFDIWSHTYKSLKYDTTTLIEFTYNFIYQILKRMTNCIYGKSSRIYCWEL